ncbi:hypothetical protein [Paraliomyxa miuraensis]|uniref:hypothetical protein n=1 Tax=Paraliomyxa miuraensis TaxID=376150 RepID=UPI0022576557|nr:hypothetical protein [Paraliomyxa miuraensis]MCX4245929.1 hypothetical protein [Paraliomyxa miuraensis]
MELVGIAIVLGVAALAVIVARGGLSGARYTITVRGEGPEGIRIQGTVPGHPPGDVAAFLADLSLPEGARLMGIPEGDRVVLRFSSSVPEHLHQRLRNYFYLQR